MTEKTQEKKGKKWGTEFPKKNPIPTRTKRTEEEGGKTAVGGENEPWEKTAIEEKGNSIPFQKRWLVFHFKKKSKKCNRKGKGSLKKKGDWRHPHPE